MSASPLRSFSPMQIADTIGNGLRELTGRQFIVDVASVKFSSSRMTELAGKAERVDLVVTATAVEEPFDVSINFTDPDGRVSTETIGDVKKC